MVKGMSNTTSEKLKIFGIGSTLFCLSIAFGYASLQTNSALAQEDDSNITIEKIEEGNISSQEVTVRGEVEELQSGISFLIEDDNLFGDSEVLVINITDDAILEATEGEPRVQVTGNVQEFSFVEIESDYSLGLDPEIYADYESMPVILASSIVPAPDLEDLAEDPEDYYGKEIAVQGEIEDVKNETIFTLKEGELIGEDELLVLNASGSAIPESDDSIVLVGELRPYVKTEFERDYDLTWDLELQREIEVEFTNKPVLVLDEAYSSAQEDGWFE